MKTTGTSFPSFMPMPKIKEEIEKNFGNSVRVIEYNRTNKKILNEYEGIITGVYSNFFTVKVKQKLLIQNKSVNYSDISIGLTNYKII